ncbi:MAG: calcium/sodium antiporter [Bacteroidales bacterium]|nr:calcium/sodium antiporter [Bacteroidales bacterium]
MEYIYLIVGFILLFIGGKYLVKGAVEFSAHLKVSTLVIGVTIVSFATSAPELAVSLRAAIINQPDISIGNIVGSNISNIALVLGLTAIIFPMPVNRNSVLFDWPVMMIISILFYIFILNLELQFYEGILFIILLVGFNYWIINRSRKKRHEKNDFKVPEISLFISLLFLIFSSISLVFGSKYFTMGAEQIARNIGVSERVISVSLIAVGTSIPELTTSLMAAFKKQMDISIGNIIGSNIFNILGILGITSIVKNLPINELTLKVDVLWMLGISILLFFFIIPLKGGKLTRIEGIVFLIIYIIYIYLIYHRA